MVAPLDVVKIRLQLQAHSLSDPPLLRAELPPGTPIYKGTLQTMRHIVAHEGITGLWKGNIPAELLYVSYAAVQFTAYRSMSMLLQHLRGQGTGAAAGGEKSPPHAAESFICGAVGGAAGTAATYPLDLLRTRFAAQGNDRVYVSLRRAVADIRRDEGPRGFFRGLSPALAQIMPYMGIFFAAYEGLRRPLGPLVPWGGGGDAAAGVMASVLAKTVVFPLDLARKRIQVQGPTRSRYVHKNIPEARGTLSTLRDILRRGGPRALYRGLAVSLFKAAPNSAVTMWTYERILNQLIAYGGGGYLEEP